MSVTLDWRSTYGHSIDWHLKYWDQVVLGTIRRVTWNWCRWTQLRSDHRSGWTVLTNVDEPSDLKLVPWEGINRDNQPRVSHVHSTFSGVERRALLSPSLILFLHHTYLLCVWWERIVSGEREVRGSELNKGTPLIPILIGTVPIGPSHFSSSSHSLSLIHYN